jgi:hypothetical protein
MAMLSQQMQPDAAQGRLLAIRMQSTAMLSQQTLVCIARDLQALVISMHCFAACTVPPRFLC